MSIRVKKMTLEGLYEYRPVNKADVEEILAVYRQSEDFLALGPVAKASREMVLADLQLSARAGGRYCGIFNEEGKMVGVLDYVPGNFEGEPSHAFLELLMIAAPYRGSGIGWQIVAQVEAEIRTHPAVTALLSGVQVNNPAGIAFWQHMGFRIHSAPKVMPDGTTVYDLYKPLR